jgi:cytochrome c oxidase cbb3-type subunit 2
MNNLFKFSSGVLLTLVISWLAFIVGGRNQFGDLEPTSEFLEENGSIPIGADLFPKAMSGIATQGSEEYIKLGCISCHTQQVRLTETGFDVERDWGKRPSVARDYILQKNILLGNTRIGPDLANVGLRGFSDEWLHRHLFDPQATVPGSICSPSPFLYETNEENILGSIEVPSLSSEKNDNYDSNQSRYITPTLRANKIVAYLQALGQNYKLPEMAFVESEEDVEPLEQKDDNETNDKELPKWLSDQINSGKEIYMKAAPGGGLCFTCHQSNGLGLAGQFPPLADSEWVLGDKPTLIKIAMFGLMGPIKVKGVDYTLAMPPPGIPPGSLTDQQIADVLTYIRNDWGNSASSISPAEVAAVRSSVKGRAPFQMWTAQELKGDSK